MEIELTGLLIGDDPVVWDRVPLGGLEEATVVVSGMRDADACAILVAARDARLDVLDLNAHVEAFGTGWAFRGYDVVAWIILQRKQTSRVSVKAAPRLASPVCFCTTQKDD